MGYMEMYEVLIDINNDEITDEEKGAAVLKMLNTIEYLFNRVFDVEEV